MVSATDRAKRALVVVIKYLAAAYGLQADVTRDSKDDLVRKAYRTVSLKVHPDKGGKEEDQRKLNGAYDSWCEAARAKSGQGRPKKQGREQGRGRDRCAGGAELGTGPGTNEKHNLNDTSERKETRRAESTSSQGGRGRTRLKREKRQERTGTRKEKQHCAGRGRRDVFLLCRLLAGTAPRHVASPLQEFLGS